MLCLGIIAFTYTTTNTLSLYAALKGTYQPGVPRPKRSRAWKLISALSIILATLLILPPTIFRSTTASEVSRMNIPLSVDDIIPTLQRFALTQNPGSEPQDGDGEGQGQGQMPLEVKASMATLGVLTLCLGIPSLLITAPSLPVPLSIRRRANVSLAKASRVVLLFISAGMAVLPGWVCRVVSDVLMVGAFGGMYVVPGAFVSSSHCTQRSPPFVFCKP